MLCAALGISLLLGAAHSAYAQAKVPLPVDTTGAIDGADYAIKVPENWNGKLLVFVHGYGEVERPVPLAPGDTTVLLSEGYALAASAMRNSGWTVEEGLVDTKRLTEYFRANIGRPSRTILWGVSMGSVVVLKSGASATAEEIRAFCKERLAPYKVPTLVEFYSELPKTQVGKVLRRQLAQPPAEAEPPPTA